MKKKLLEILNNIDENIAGYEGNNLFEDGMIDSFTVVEIVTEIERVFNIEINADDVVEKNFSTVENIWLLIDQNLREE